MNTHQADSSGKLQKKEAEQLSRFFNVAFNSALLYGGAHPTTKRSVVPFATALIEALDRLPMISIVVDRGALFVEEWPADQVINARRMLQQLEKSAIVSVTFLQGVTTTAIELFIEYVGNSNAPTSVEKIKKMLHQRGALGIELNYVRFGRITNDQTIVGKGDRAAERQANSDTGLEPGLSKQSLLQIDEVLSLAQLFEKSGAGERTFTDAALDPVTASNAVSSLVGLRETVQRGSAPPVDVLLNAIYELKIDLSDAIAVQRETGKLLAAPAALVEEVDGLTCDVIVKLVREEYGEGNVPIKRFAAIIRRMLPDVGELQRVLPKLKIALLGAGMSLSNYLQLVRTINVELESETLTDTLQDAASGIGVSVEELVKAIRTQPDEAARLLVLASEIRGGTEDDEAQLSSLLTEYIEKVSTSIALESKKFTSLDDGKLLRQMLQQLEQQLVENMQKHGVGENVLLQVRSQLAHRLDTVQNAAAAQWIVTAMDASPQMSVEDVSAQLLRMVGEQGQLDRLHDPLMAAMVSRGFDREQIAALLCHLAEKVAEGTLLKLPPGVLSVKNFQFMLDREVKQNNRYGTPFTTVMLTVEGLLAASTVRLLAPELHRKILPKLFALAKHMLRDIDLVGALEPPDDIAVFMLLTMTDRDGARVAEQRIVQKAATLQLVVENVACSLLVATSITAPQEGAKNTLQSYMQEVHANHVQSVGRVRGATGENRT